MSDESDDALLEAFVRSLVDACVQLHDDMARLPASEQESTADSDFSALEQLRLVEWRANEIRTRAIALALEEQGLTFAEWMDGLMARFGSSSPPLSVQRLREPDAHRLLLVVASAAHGPLEDVGAAGWSVHVVVGAWAALVALSHDSFSLVLVDAALPPPLTATWLLVRAAIRSRRAVRWVMGEKEPPELPHLLATGLAEAFVRQPTELLRVLDRFHRTR